MQGLLLVDKPKTWTSFDVVNYVRKIVAAEEGKKPKNCKVGHTGTLDPLATGLLVLLIGKEYTRRAGELSKLDKTYEVTMKLGETSTTADAEGQISPYVPPQPDKQSMPSAEALGASRRQDLRSSGDVPSRTPSSGAQPFLALHSSTNGENGEAVQVTTPTEKAVLEALEQLQGHIMQTPPAFSAMKINGQRAYKLARKGEVVELEARPVTIYSNRLTDYSYPYVTFTSHVSSGTYIRSLVEDLGKLLQTGAYMSDLKRTEIDRFSLQNAVQVTDLTAETIQQNLIDL